MYVHLTYAVFISGEPLEVMDASIWERRAKNGTARTPQSVKA